MSKPGLVLLFDRSAYRVYCLNLGQKKCDCVPMLEELDLKTKKKVVALIESLADGGIISNGIISNEQKASTWRMESLH